MKIRSALAIVGAGTLAFALGACSTSTESDEAATVVQTVTETVEAEAAEVDTEAVAAAPAEETEAPVEDLEIPSNLVGMNGQLAFEQLSDAGFTGVRPTSIDPGRAMPVLYNNWTVTSVEPGAGAVVPSDSTIILNMTKD
ncbi:MAG TPA: PASTA domain-containing protein [Candidatus Corynebacterium avicola]|uniref:PASTA domain-containing protein n=1 Tax=Candidatus Corynebacterium avicola TaxID=2838527 RepID=A0A9D1RRQ1_9CORY|nr:PASTA domain-containing protein [Candidatus Corynebacterium avicola]